MSEAPDDLKSTKSHEWVHTNDDGSVTIGITDHAQELLGDLVYVEVPEAGRELDAEEACAVVESVKAAADLYMPISGEITEVNEHLADTPEILNSDPFGEGWIVMFKSSDPSEFESLISAEDYEKLTGEE